MQSAMKRIRHNDQLLGDLFRQVDVQRAEANVFQVKATAQAKASGVGRSWVRF